MWKVGQTVYVVMPMAVHGSRHPAWVVEEGRVISADVETVYAAIRVGPSRREEFVPADRVFGSPGEAMPDMDRRNNRRPT